MFSLLKRNAPEDTATRLVNQAIGGQSVLYRFFREGLACEDTSITKLELTFFAMSILTFAFVLIRHSSNPETVLDAFTRQMLRRAMKATGTTESFEDIVGQYQVRFAEYQALLPSLLKPAQSATDNPAATLLLHAYEQITDSSAQSKMVHILAGSKIVAQFVADNIDFVRNGLLAEP